MRALPGTDPRSPFPGGRPALYVVGSEDDPANVSPVPLRPSAPRSLEEPMGQGEPANDSMSSAMAPPPVMVSVPAPIRLIAKLIAAIRWFPTAWALLCSIPSEAHQAWTKAFGPKEE